MKDETIRAGDLVMVVHSCCGRVPFGRTRTVFSVIQEWHGFCRCGKEYSGPHASSTAKPDKLFPVAWLKKINPPAVDETVETSDEVTV